MKTQLGTGSKVTVIAAGLGNGGTVLLEHPPANAAAIATKTRPLLRIRSPPRRTARGRQVHGVGSSSHGHIVIPRPRDKRQLHLVYAEKGPRPSRHRQFSRRR